MLIGEIKMLAILLVILKVTSAELGDFNNQVASGLISGLKFPQGSESCISFHARILYHIKPCNYLDLLDFKTVLKCLESIPISLSPIPEELIKCEKQLQTDSIRLNNTLPIFKNPLTYNLTVNSNVVLKNVDITKDLIDIQMFLKDSLDFEAAAALGEVARRMFIRESIEKEIDELFKGFVAGIGLTDDAYKLLERPEVCVETVKSSF